MQTGVERKSNIDDIDPIEPAKITAGIQINQWWRRIRSSGKKKYFNNQNVHYSEKFRLFLNKQKVPRFLTYFQDNALLQDIQNGNWQSERFKKPNFHASLSNLYAAGKITWEQKATLSDIMATVPVYGPFIAYPTLTSEGEFTPEAKTHLLPFLKKSNLPQEQTEFSEEELTEYRRSLKNKPLSERFFFYFPEQQFNHNGSSPSPHSGLRDNLITLRQLSFPIIRATQVQTKDNPANVEIFNKKFLENYKDLFQNLTTATHPQSLQYHGIVKLSFAAENALGIIEHGPENWWEVIPRLGNQTIDDIEELSKARLRPTLSPESFQLGLTREQEIVHGTPHEYPEVVAHDDYHRKVTALLGNDIHQAVERIITIARQTFGFKWSKDIWLLRDFDLTSTSLSARTMLATLNLDKKLYTTRLFACALLQPYLLNQLENCDEDVQEVLKTRYIMAGKDRANQIALAFVIDLVRNPHIWEGFNILNDESQYRVPPYLLLIRYAKFLNKNGVFADDMKANVIKFDLFLKCKLDQAAFALLENPEAAGLANRNAYLKSALTKLNAVDAQEIAKYKPKRDNRRVFLGFEKDPATFTRYVNHFKKYANSLVSHVKKFVTSFVFYVKKFTNSFVFYVKKFANKFGGWFYGSKNQQNRPQAKLNQNASLGARGLPSAGTYPKPLTFSQPKMREMKLQPFSEFLKSQQSESKGRPRTQPKT